ncbi:hypothetical protein [Stackebrandtia soli]|uniref:hypothetical protein n=1 Tax=Stackebrandtia soli TaxID=1892856 RepID=UPI0039ED5556
MTDGVRLRRKGVRGVVAFGGVLLAMLVAGTVFLGARLVTGEGLPPMAVWVILAFWLFAGGFCCLMWALIIRPCVIFERDAFVMRNVVTTVRVGYRLIVDATGSETEGVQIDLATGESIQPFVLNGGRYFGSLDRDRPGDVADELCRRSAVGDGDREFSERRSTAAAWVLSMGPALIAAAFIIVMIATAAV